MKKRNCFYLTILIALFTTTSCVSYETSSSYSRNKKTNSNRWVYDNGPKTAKSNTTKTKSASKKEYTSKSSEVKTVLKEAGKYKGTPYKLGGTTSSGMDCSGLVYVSFQKIDKSLPRRSIDMAGQGSPVSIAKVKEGDLLFFATSGGSKINHVGIVYEVSNSGISFIHASSSKGVMISSMEENYWKGKFVKARRVL